MAFLLGTPSLPRLSPPKIPLLSRASPEIDPVAESSPSPAATSSEGQSTSSVEGNECVVCGDKSSGKHYGQYSCEGTKQCPVDVHHRNQCQYCRLKKCVKMGMRKEAVQRGRVPPPSLSFTPFLPFIPSPFLNPMLASMFRPEARAAQTETVGEYGAQLLFSVIDWTKHLPFFADLCASDQVLLLQNSWSQLFMLTATQSPVPAVVSTTIASLRVKTEGTKMDLSEDANNFHSQLEAIRTLHLDVAEMNCVKAAVLFNPDTLGLLDKGKVESIQEKIQASLDDYCRSHKAVVTGRFGCILLRLPTLRSFSPLLVERLFFSGLPSPVSSVVQDLLQQPSALPRWPLFNPFLQFPLPFIS